jgi:chromosome partitioning protein
MPSTACWSWDARVTSASPDPGRGWGYSAHVPDPCTTAPCAPSFIDLRALKRTEKIIRLSGKPAFAVLNLCPPVGDDADQAEQALIKLGYTVCPHRIVTRAAARRSYAVDQSVFEFEPNGKAATEFSAVYKFSCSHWVMKTEEHEKEAHYA